MIWSSLNGVKFWNVPTKILSLNSNSIWNLLKAVITELWIGLKFHSTGVETRLKKYLIDFSKMKMKRPRFNVKGTKREAQIQVKVKLVYSMTELIHHLLFFSSFYSALCEKCSKSFVPTVPFMVFSTLLIGKDIGQNG